MINPRQLQVGYAKDRGNPFAMKAYFAIVGRPLRKKYRTATEAKTRATQVFSRWCRLYDAAIVAQMTSSSPAVTEEEQVVEAQG